LERRRKKMKRTNRILFLAAALIGIIMFAEPRAVYARGAQAAPGGSAPATRVV
jgi:hypothetical protein